MRKRRLHIFFAAAALAALCVAPAHGVAASSESLASAYGESSLSSLRLLAPQSLEGGFEGSPMYTFDGADDYLFGRPTSDDTIYEWENPNVDRSKNTALIPPGFGTPTSYLPGSGEYLTPNLVPGALSGGLVNQTGGAGIPDGGYPTVDVGASGTGGSYIGFTEVTSNLYYSDGSLGTLKIPSIGVTVKVYEGTDTSTLAKGAGHFEGASIWDGNVSLAGHNRGMHGIFGDLHTLSTGDIITLTTVLGTRTYAVSSVTKVDVTDTSGLASTAENCITLYTCVMDQPAYRWCVRAVEV